MGNNSTHLDKDKKRGRKGKKRKGNVTTPGIEIEDRLRTDGVAADTNIALKKSEKDIRTEGTFFEDFVQVLPDEILISIFLRCDIYALSVVAPKVCKQFYNNTLPDGYLWQQKCKCKNRRLLAGQYQQNRSFKYLYITQKLFHASGTTQNTKKVDQRAELNQMLIKCDENGFTGEGKYVKFFNEYHARWQGTINDTFDVNIEEYYNYEQYPYYYEGKLDPETGVIKGRYHKNNIEGVFEFKLLPKVVLKHKNQ